MEGSRIEELEKRVEAFFVEIRGLRTREARTLKAFQGLLELVEKLQADTAIPVGPAIARLEARVREAERRADMAIGGGAGGMTYGR